MTDHLTLKDLRVVCEHGYNHAHCDEHPGKGSHFGVVTHEGGCGGPTHPTVDDLVGVLLEEGGRRQWECVEEDAVFECVDASDAAERRSLHGEHRGCGEVVVFRVGEENRG